MENFPFQRVKTYPSFVVKFTVGALVAVLLTSCTEMAGPAESAGVEIATRNTVFGRTVSGAGCGVGVSRAVALPEFVDMPDAYAGNINDQTTDDMKSWAERIMQLSSRARVSENDALLLKTELLRAAGSNAMQWPSNWSQGEDRPPSVIYHTMETLYPAVIGYAQNKDIFSLQEQEIFENWSGEIVSRVGRTEKIRQWQLDNKKYQYGALLAAQSLVTSDRRGFSQSRRIYETAMRGMRSDGSLPGDTGRGGNALHYSNLALANLVAIAELNFATGTDLYGSPDDPRSIHHAIKFLAQATSNPSLVAGYADTPGWEDGSFIGYSPTRQDRRWADRSSSGWGYYYLARYQNTDAGRQLLAASPFLRLGRSGVHQQSGGNARCNVG